MRHASPRHGALPTRRSRLRHCSTELSAGRASYLLNYLRYGHFLDERQTETLSLEAAVFNPDLFVYGLWR